MAKEKADREERALSLWSKKGIEIFLREKIIFIQVYLDVLNNKAYKTGMKNS